MLGRIARGVLRHRVATALVVLLIVGTSLAGALRLRLDFSSTSFYGSGSSAVQELEAFTQRWGADDRKLLILVETREAGGVLSRPALEAIQVLASDLAEVPDAGSVVSLPGLRRTPDGPTLLETLRRLEGPAAQLATQAIRSEPRLVPLILSENARHGVIVVELATSTDDLAATVRTVRRFEEVVDRHRSRAPPGVRFELAGVPAIRAAFFGLTLRDQQIFGPAMALLIGAILFATFRRFYVVLGAAIAAGLPLLVLLGIMGWIGEPIGLLNQAYFTLIPVIAISDYVHLLVRMHEEGLQRPPSEAIVVAVQRVGFACLLTTMTTSLGFASLAVSQAEVLARFGLFAAAGLVVAYVTVLTAVPLVLSLTARTLARPPGPEARISRALAAIGRVTSRRRLVIVIVAAVLGAAAYPGVRKVVVDNYLTGLLEADHPVRTASESVDHSLGGVLSLEIDLRRAAPGWDSPSGRAWLEQLQDWAADQPQVRAVQGPGSGSGSGSGDFIGEQGQRARVSLRTPDLGGRAFLAFSERVEQHVESTLPEDAEATLTGTTLVAYQGVNRLTAELRQSLVLVFVVVTAAIGVLMRSPALALVSIPVNLLPLWLAYALVGVSGRPLDPISTVVLTVALGIAVDDTIHLLARYREASNEGCSGSAAIGVALQRSGRAIVITSVVLAAGLSLNAGSSFPPLQVLGLLGAAVIVLALLADLLLLPVLVPSGPGQSSDLGRDADP